MVYHCKCLTCGAEWHCRGDYESDTNATNLEDSKIHEGQCDHDNFEIIGQDAEEWDDNVI